MVRVRYHLPAFSAEEAERLARDCFNLTATSRPLPSERDQNFLLTTADGAAYVLKIANSSEDEAVLDLQNRALEHLAERAPGLALSRVCRAPSGAKIVSTTSAQGEKHFVRLLTYVPGRLWAETQRHTPAMLRSLGRVLGEIDAALLDFAHPAAERALKWDLARAGWVRDYVQYVGDLEQRALVGRCLEAFEREVAPRLSELRSSVIYNDGNDYNILVERRDGERQVVGVIDFGDMVHTQTVCEVAVAGAYALMGKANPLRALGQLTAGFHSALRLSEAELSVVFPLVCTRLCTTVANAAYQRTVEPDNDYLVISEAPAWRLLEQLARIPPRLAEQSLRAACGLEPCPESAAVVRWLEEHRGQAGPVVTAERLKEQTTLDLSVGSLHIGQPAEWADGTLARQLEARLTGRTGIGRYDEARPFYSGERYRVEEDSGPEWPTIHLGLDLFVPAGTPVLAPLEGQVVAIMGEEDKTVVLRHKPADGPEFHSLYRHLTTESVMGLSEDCLVQRGAVVGQVAAAGPGSPLPDHLHLQLVAGPLDGLGAVPATCRPSERAMWRSACPSPHILAGLPDEGSRATSTSSEAILRARREHVGRNLSLAYDRPLQIVRGYGAYLYDEDGRAYLDTVNNVAHVGHSHPRVVRAGQAQMAVLNTNTRYLHENLARYAQRLCATLPEPLSVCYFVCSGSEANELALRLARSYTGRQATIVVEAAYHGNTGGLIDISPYKHAGPGGRGAPPHVHVVSMPDTYRGLYRRDDPRAGERYAAAVGEAVERAHGPATFIAESILSCGGQIVLPEGYLQASYQHVRRAGGVCIADEVQVGFGRVGSHFWAFETQGVAPDIVTLGKPIGNGHPLAAVITTPEIAAAFDNGMEYFNTFGGNPASCAIGLAVLDVIQDERLQANALRAGGWLLEQLRGLMARHTLIGDVRGLGLFIGVELVRDRVTLEPAGAQAGRIANRMREHGVLMSTDGPYHNVLKIKPPLVFSEADGDLLVRTMDKVLGEFEAD